MNFGLLKTPDRLLLISLLALVGLHFTSLPVLAEYCTLDEIRFQPGTVANDELDLECRLAQTHTLAFKNAFQRVVDEATLYLMARPRTGTEAVVLDLDETLMDNRAYYLVFGDYDDDHWADWVRLAQAPVIPETLALVNWLKANNYKLYFISGRRESWRASTEANLKAMGVSAWDGLFLKPDDYDRDTAADFKTAARQAIQSKGEIVVLSLGDQRSDLKGGYGEGFLLPNPLYFIP